jgi:hypothetical protein
MAIISKQLAEFWRDQNQRQPKDAPSKAAYFIYQTLNYVMNIHGLNWANRLVRTRTEPAGAGLCWNRYTRNSPKTEPLVTLHGTIVVYSVVRGLRR